MSEYIPTPVTVRDTEVGPKSRRGIHKATAAILGLCVAPFALTGCSAESPDRADSPSVTNTEVDSSNNQAEAEESPELSPKEQAVAEFLAELDTLEAPVAISAEPLVVTERAEQRNQLGKLNIYSNHRLAESAKEAVDKLNQFSDPQVQQEARIYLDAQLAEAASSTLSGIYTFEESERLIEGNAEAINNKRAALESISDQGLKDIASKLLDLGIAKEIIDTREPNAASEALVLQLSEETQALVRSALTDAKVKAELEQQHSRQKSLLGELLIGSSDPRFYGSSYGADVVNGAVVKLKEARSLNPDTQFPAAQDLFRDEVYGISGPEDLAVLTAKLEAAPKKFAPIIEDAKNGAISKVVEIVRQSGGEHTIANLELLQEHLKEADAYEAAFGLDDTIARDAVSEQVRMNIAQAYPELDTLDDQDAERDQLMLSRLTDDPDLMKLALAARGGDTTAKDMIDTIFDASSEQWELAGYEGLMNGSNWQARDINERAAKYIALNS